VLPLNLPGVLIPKTVMKVNYVQIFPSKLLSRNKYVLVSLKSEIPIRYPGTLATIVTQNMVKHSKDFEKQTSTTSACVRTSYEH